MKKVLITGANGFISKSISKRLKESGMFVIGTSRTADPVRNFDKVIGGVLGEPLNGVYEKHEIDVIIHCAYDKHDIDNRRNAEGTILWAEEAERNNVGLQIFMSSLSADKDAIAPYGKKKYEVERWFIEHNQVIFRLGLVAGSEGLFGRIISTVRRSLVVPLVDGGKTLTYLTDIDTLCNVALDTVLGENEIQRGKVWFLQQETPFFFVDILMEIKRQSNLFRIFIPIPFIMIALIVSILEKFRFLKLGINTNNLKGMRQLGGKKFKSDLDFLGYSETPLEKLIEKAVH